jgi:hypothetical protein
MTIPTPYLPIPEITPLEKRAILRFQYDAEFHKQCYAAADELLKISPDAELNTRLQDAMRAIQGADESLVSDEAIVRGARYLGGELLGLPYALASEAEKEGLKAGVRRLLAAVKGDTGG